jgi:hypothetical protein
MTCGVTILFSLQGHSTSRRHPVELPTTGKSTLVIVLFAVYAIRFIGQPNFIGGWDAEN